MYLCIFVWNQSQTTKSFKKYCLPCLLRTYSGRSVRRHLRQERKTKAMCHIGSRVISEAKPLTPLPSSSLSISLSLSVSLFLSFFSSLFLLLSFCPYLAPKTTFPNRLNITSHFGQFEPKWSRRVFARSRVCPLYESFWLTSYLPFHELKRTHREVYFALQHNFSEFIFKVKYFPSSFRCYQWK